MQQASPGCDPYSINRESGQNKNVPDGSGGSTLANDAGVDWFAFQEVLGKMGYMGIVDLEGPSKGAEEYRAEGILPTRLVNVAGLLAIGAVLVGVLRYNKQVTTAKAVETVDGNPEPEGFHFWKD
jgi:hypothetical protein